MNEQKTIKNNNRGSDLHSHIGTLVARLRKQQGFSQSNFAEKLGTTQSAVARIEKGQQNISTNMLNRISEVLGRDIMSLSSGALNVEINGGKKLTGEVETKTSKNATVALLSASLLNKNVTTLHHVPKIEDVFRLIEVLQSIGVEVTWNDNSLVIQPPVEFDMSNINQMSGSKTRSIILLIGSIMHFHKEFAIPRSGGCKLGERTIKPHLYALESFGVSIETREDLFHVSRSDKHSSEIILYEKGDTVTENAILASALTPSQTTLKYASANYQVQDLCFFLQEMGVEIEGVGTSTLVIKGVTEINKPVEYEVSEDPIESMFFIATAVVTKSSITIKRCPIDFLELELLTLEKMGFSFEQTDRYKALNGKTDLVDIKTKPSQLTAPEEKISPQPYPGLNIDNLPFFAVIATQAEGQTLIHDWVYENRAIYYKELDKLGAETILADPHRIYITGPSKLSPQEIICPPALRPAAIILIAMLATPGKSILRNIYSINRGYEDIIDRLQDLGAEVSFLRSI